MRFDEVVVPLDAFVPDAFVPGPAAHRPDWTEAGRMQEELAALEAKYKGLQTLVAELLVTNQTLRGELAKLRPRPAHGVAHSL
jgi:hypothetical protein